MRHAVIVDAHYCGEGGQITTKAARRKDLRNQADIGQRRLIAVAVKPGAWVLREQPLSEFTLALFNLNEFLYVR